MKVTNTYAPYIYMSSPQYVFVKPAMTLYYIDLALLIHALLKWFWFLLCTL